MSQRTPARGRGSSPGRLQAALRLSDRAVLATLARVFQQRSDLEVVPGTLLAAPAHAAPARSAARPPGGRRRPRGARPRGWDFVAELVRWGVVRIQGELRRLGYRVTASAHPRILRVTASRAPVHHDECWRTSSRARRPRSRLRFLSRRLSCSRSSACVWRVRHRDRGPGGCTCSASRRTPRAESATQLARGSPVELRRPVTGHSPDTGPGREVHCPPSTPCSARSVSVCCPAHLGSADERLCGSASCAPPAPSAADRC